MKFLTVHTTINCIIAYCQYNHTINSLTFKPLLGGIFYLIFDKCLILKEENYLCEKKMANNLKSIQEEETKRILTFSFSILTFKKNK